MRHLAIAASLLGVLAVATANASSAAQAAETTLIETGTITRFDTTSGVLTLSTPRGEQQFPIGAKTRVREGWHRIDVATLSSLTGRDVRVRYVENGGQKTVKSVSVSQAKPRKGGEM